MPSSEDLHRNASGWLPESFGLPKDSGRKTSLSRAVHEVTSEAPLVLLIIRDTDIWPSSANPHLFDLVRNSTGDVPSVQSHPGHLFGHEDRDLCEALYALGLYFVWGSVFIAPSIPLIIEVSHDEVVSIWSNTTLGREISSQR